MGIKDRLKRLETENAMSCQQCRGTPRRVVGYFPDEGEEPPEAEFCPGCGRELLVALRVVYEDVRGEGLS